MVSFFKNKTRSDPQQCLLFPEFSLERWATRRDVHSGLNGVQRHFGLCYIYYTRALQSWSRNVITFYLTYTQKKKMVLAPRTFVKDEAAGALGELSQKNST